MAEQNPMFADDHLAIGIFGSNCSSGASITKIPERWDNSWENNLNLAKMADEAGIDFLLPVARWIGYGGETNFNSNVLETTTWATALLAHTKRIKVFTTMHTAVHNPVVAAKQLATVDQIGGGGRVALNVVAGWNKPEFEALGIDMPAARTDRYGYAQEWLDVVSALWTRSEPFDWDGTHFQLKGVYGFPRPRRRVPVMSAGGSNEGRDFAARNADMLLIPAIDLDKSPAEIAALEQKAADAGRGSSRIDVVAHCHIVCRPSEQEAREYVEYSSQQHADWDAVDQVVALLVANSRSFPPEALARLRNRFSLGHGGYPLTGTPAQVAEGLAAVRAAGFAGVAVSFVDYLGEFPYFRDEVLPRLECAGIRRPR